MYEFIVYPTSQQELIDGLNIDLGKPRVHPDGTLSMTNINGNKQFSEVEKVFLSDIDGLIFVSSELIADYKREGGWNAVEELP